MPPYERRFPAPMALARFDPKVYTDLEKHPLEIGEVVLFLGYISNCGDHCAVAKQNGAVLFMVHPGDFVELSEQ